MTSDPFAPEEGIRSPGDNLPVQTVAEISGAVKRTMEGAFARVRVRGEVSGFKRATSGHLYLALKDEQAVLDAVCWRGSAARLSIKPEDGMEVVATGRLTTYPGRSKYQMVIDSLELAGEGALLKLLEDRRRKLAAEGLFDADRKKPLPFLPGVIGVVTSPTGAVIRDILHRLADRFPRHVLVWPVLVQGEGAAQQVATAIRGFNGLDGNGPAPRPDLLIVARGGGSLEDLWPFNEEVVVRAAAESDIPLISAVGHETDTTLIDFAADQRAPTPSAAAEMAVPVRLDLKDRLTTAEGRMVGGLRRMLEERTTWLAGLARGLPNPRAVLEDMTQRLDDRIERHGQGMRTFLDRRTDRVSRLAAGLIEPRQLLAAKDQELTALNHRQQRAMTRILERLNDRLAVPAGRVQAPRHELQTRSRHLADTAKALKSRTEYALGQAERQLRELDLRLEAHSHQRIQEKGFVLVTDATGRLVKQAKGLKSGDGLTLGFIDGEVGAVVADALPPAPRSRKKGADHRQGQLL